VFLQIRQKNTPQTIRYIEERGWLVNENLNNYGWTALHLAAFQGDSDLVEYLLRKGADSTLTNNSGNTPLMLAEHKGNSEVYGLLKNDATLMVEVPLSSSA